MKNNNITNILVPLDFSESSLNALETAIVIAKQQKCQINLLNVVDSSFMFGFKGVYYISEKTIDSVVDVSARMLNPLLTTLKKSTS
jgi:nucleotide-binding universal stress UspA family protein